MIKKKELRLRGNNLMNSWSYRGFSIEAASILFGARCCVK
jgi:hypothetical protein